MAALLLGASACVALLYQPGVLGEVALTLPITCAFCAVVVGLVVRFEARGAVLFQCCATAVFTAHCYQELRGYGLENPAILLTTGFLGVVNMMAMLLAAGWAERCVAGAARECLLAEVLRQRDELQRLSAERGVQQAFLAATLDQLPAGVVTLRPRRDGADDERRRPANWFAGL